MSPAYHALPVPRGEHGGFGRLLNPAFGFLSCPIPPPPFPPGRGSPKVYFAGGFAPGTPALDRLRHLQSLPYRCPAGARPPPGTQTAGIAGAARIQSRGCKGLRPRHPGIKPPAALTVPAVQVPRGGLCLWLRQLGAKPIEPPFYWQCRQPRREGDRGRWNNPSHATAAFEMVLSPGAGRASAARGQARDKEGKPPFLCGKQKEEGQPRMKAEPADTESGSALLSIPPHPRHAERAVRSARSAGAGKAQPKTEPTAGTGRNGNADQLLPPAPRHTAEQLPAAFPVVPDI